MSRCLPGFVHSHSGENSPLMPISSFANLSCLPPERVKITMNSKRETNGRVKMGYCCLPPERGKITVNSKNETDGRVNIGQGSRWTTAVYPPSPPPQKESN